MAKMLLLSIVMLIVIGSIVTGTYLWLAKREERKMQENELDHEERMHLDDLAYGDDTDEIDRELEEEFE